MNGDETEWQQFLDGHQDFVEEFSEEPVDTEKSTEKEYGLTLFSGEPDGYFIVFNTQIDIFQFVKLLRYFFGIDGIEIGHAEGSGHHYHNINDELYDDEDDDE